MCPGTLGLRAGEIRLTSTNYTYTRSFSLVASLTISRLLESFVKGDDPELCPYYFVEAEGDFPLRVSSQVAWLRKQQPSKVVILLLHRADNGVLHVHPVNQNNTRPDRSTPLES